MPDIEGADVERRLCEAGVAFIRAHDDAASAIRQAVRAGMTPEAVSRVSGLSAETVAAFLRTGRD